MLSVFQVGGWFVPTNILVLVSTAAGSSGTGGSVSGGTKEKKINHGCNKIRQDELPGWFTVKIVFIYHVRCHHVVNKGCRLLPPVLLRFLCLRKNCTLCSRRRRALCFGTHRTLCLRRRRALRLACVRSPILHPLKFTKLFKA